MSPLYFVGILGYDGEEKVLNSKVDAMRYTLIVR